MSAYTAEEIRYIEQFHDLLTPEQIGEKLGRPAFAIKKKMVELGIRGNAKKSDFRRWEEWEIAYVMNNYGKVNTETIARELGRTHASVCAKAKRKKLAYSENAAEKRRKQATDKATESLLENYVWKTTENMSEEAIDTRDRYADDGELDEYEQLYMLVVNLSAKGNGSRWVADQMGWDLQTLKKYKDINRIVI